MKKHPAFSLFRFLTGLVKPGKGIRRRLARRLAAAPEAERREIRGRRGQDKGMVQEPDRADKGEETQADFGATPDEPAESEATGQAPVEPEQNIPAEEQAGGGGRTGLVGAGGEYKNRFDAAQGRLKNNSSNEEAQALLEQAIALLESLSEHPAIQDYGENKRKLDEIEQRLGYGSYPQ